jgi:hypothetical protein
MSTDKKGFLEEERGRSSMMRLMSAVALVTAVVFGSVVLSHEEPSWVGAYIVFGFLVAAFAPKAFQKFAESSFSHLPGDKS